MKPTRLIMINGISGTGKSTIARYVSTLLDRHGIDHVYLHEECAGHPIRDGEFTIGDLTDKDDMVANMHDMVQRYQRLKDTIIKDGRPHVMEGCLFEMTIRYLFESSLDEKEILAFYRRIFDVIRPLHTTLVFLHTQHVKVTLNQAFDIRGDWWKTLILDSDNMPYMMNHKLKGAEGVYQMWNDYQALGKQAFDAYQGPKVLGDVSKRDYETIRKQVSYVLGFPYFEEPRPQVHNPDQYAGDYHWNHEVRLRIVSTGTSIHAVAFWPVMSLNQVEKDHFRFDAFPIDLFVIRNAQKDVTAIRVKGNYDWDIMGKTLLKQKI